MTLTKPIHRLKRDAKLLSRESGIPLHEALDQMARQEGFQSWGLLAAHNNEVKVVEDLDPDSSKITKLPLDEPDRTTFVNAANAVFERILEQIEARNPTRTRQLWNAEHYVDELLLRDDMLPISRDYALSLVDAFLVGYVINLATKADDLVENG